jgi:hypothetical protein
MADSINALREADGTPLGVEVNLLFKYGGSLETALDYFQSLPPNGYNVIQLNDTYASLLARQSTTEPALVPLTVAQVTFSQLYIRTGDPRYTDADEFVSYARRADTAPQIVANFASANGQAGLEDFLLARFIRANDLQSKAEPEIQTADSRSRDLETPGPALRVSGYESGSERYFSLFQTQLEDRSDALIEQPGDIAQLLDDGLLEPIVTLLPEDSVTQTLGARFDSVDALPSDDAATCDAVYRYRGFFVPADIPDDRRRYLEWLFLAGFNSDSFQAFNRDLYMDVLYDDPVTISTYCSPEVARERFEASVQSYRACHETDISGTGQ